MSSLCKYLAANLLVKTQTKIANLRRDNDWTLEDSNGNHYGPFELIIITAPPAQTVELLSKYSYLSEEIARVEMWPCWTLMLITENKREIPLGGLSVTILSWVGLGLIIVNPNEGHWIP